jgi:phage terminase large subunit-like protein
LIQAGKRGFEFSEWHAVEAIEFIETCCCHSKGQFAGQPLRLTACQKFILWSLFGWRRQSDGLRRFKRAYLTMARKWGKSTFAAALALLLLVFDNPVEAGAELYAAATTKKQARIVHSEAKRMVRKSPTLKRRLQCTADAIDYADEESSFQVLSSDGSTTDGQNLHAAILDELHAWRAHHRDLHEKLHTAGGARLQPLWVTITTAGDDKSQIWMEEHDYARRTVESVITGTIIDDTLFAFICQLDEGDDPFNPRVWIKANPHIGESVSLDYCQEQANEARHKPASMNRFLRYVCNLKTATSERAILPELWAAGNSEPIIIDGQRGFAAFDLGRSNDWAAVAVVIPREVQRGGKAVLAYEAKVHCWTCRESPLDITRAPFTQFAADGHLTVCSGDAVDFDEVEEYIVDISQRAEIVSWAFDRTFGQQMAQNLLNKHSLEIFPFSQSARFYNEPVRTLLRLVKDGLLLHGGDPCLGWQAGNLAILRNAKDEWMPDKIGSLFKIDGMVALLMALSEALYHGSAPDGGSSIILI